jgi:hypothetical protein
MTFLEGRLDTKITAGAMGGPTQPQRSKVYAGRRLKQNFSALMPTISPCSTCSTS